jgi:hypothetical protein
MSSSQSMRGHLRRRDLLALGAAWPGLAAARSLCAATPAPSPVTTAPVAGILVFLSGGPSHLDTFDPKPDAPSEFRGEFGSIATKIPGVRFCEHLPKLAGCADRFAVLHGVSHSLADHSLGSEYLSTGTKPTASLSYPAYGSVVAKERPPAIGVPRYVATPRPVQNSGFLGMQYDAFSVSGIGNPRQTVAVPGITLPSSLPLADFERRHHLLAQIDRRYQDMVATNDDFTAVDGFNRQTYEILRSPKTREAFDLSRESPAFVKRFGGDSWSATCLLAIRLVEAGVGFVAMSLGGWDTHTGNFVTLKQSLLPKLDGALSGLFTGLADRGLLESTAVLVTGEFGRSPRIGSGPTPGRDHYPRCMSVLMAGHRIQGGQVVGGSDETASAPQHTAYSPDDVAATYYENLRIDPAKVYQTSSGRPITLVRDGQAIKNLLS